MTAYRHTGGGEKIAGGGDENNKMEGKSKDNGGGGTALMYARHSTHAEAWQLRTDAEVSSCCVLCHALVQWLTEARQLWTDY